jgi:hypothetical protein
MDGYTDLVVEGLRLVAEEAEQDLEAHRLMDFIGAPDDGDLEERKRLRERFERSRMALASHLRKHHAEQARKSIGGAFQDPEGAA